MNASARPHLLVQITGLITVVVMAALSGCGVMSRRGAADGDRPGILFSTVDDAAYAIVAATSEEVPKRWHFTLESRRATLDKGLRFVWDFGDGETYEGIEQDYTFASQGSHVVSVTAIGSDGTVAFVRTVEIDVGIPAPDGSRAPTANAGENQTVHENESVFLDGNGSVDLDGDELTYEWTQTAGPDVFLSGVTAPIASFVTPIVDGEVELTFTLTVSDGIFSAEDTMTVSVLDVLEPASVGPVAGAGADQRVVAGGPVTLDGSGSNGSGEGELSFRWIQTCGPPVTLINDSQAIAAFEAPAISRETETLCFEMTVSEGGLPAVDEVRVVVVRAPPRGDAGVVPYPCNDVDNDGICYTADNCPTHANADQLDNDADGLGNPCDGCPNDAFNDADGDGVCGDVDNCPNDGNKTEPGFCGCGQPDRDSDGDGTPDCNDNCPNDANKTAPGVCGCGRADTDADGDGVADCLTPGNCITGTPNWQTFTVAPQTGTFTVRFDAIPDRANMDGLVGLSFGAGSTFADFAAIARFAISGTIDARNGNGYQADNTVQYTPGVRYSFRLPINVPARTYSIYVTPEGSTEQTVGADYAFRTEQSSVTTLDHWGVWAGVGSHRVCAFALGDCQVDSDNDGVNDCNDGCPNDPAKTAPGVCGCGVSDSTDSDGDGVPDCNDQCPGEVDGDADGDGVANCVDQCPGAPDVDTDGDGTLDCRDSCPNDPNKTDPGVCGCGAADVDSDGDGALNCNDGCPNDPNKTAPGLCGCNRSDVDANGNGIPDGCEAQTTNSITQWGITWTFDGQYEYGQFVNGDYWVVGPVTVTSTTKPHATPGLDGSMVNPMPPDLQGYHKPLNGYNPSLDVSRSLPITLNPNSSLVSAISWAVGEPGAPRESGSIPGCTRPALRTVAVLTVLASAPPEGTFRPPYSGIAKPLYSTASINHALLPNLAPVGTDGITISALEADLKPVFLDHKMYWTGYYLHATNGLPHYGRDLSARINDASLMLMLDPTLIGDKTTLVVRFVQLGIDLYAIAANGGYHGDDGGGIGPGRKWPIILAGLLLNDPAMKNIGMDLPTEAFQEDCQTYYGSNGTPAWGDRHCTRPWTDPGSLSYRVCCTANNWVGAVLSAHIMGAKQLWNHSALFDYQDMYMAEDHSANPWQRSWSDFAEEMWDRYRRDFP